MLLRRAGGIEAPAPGGCSCGSASSCARTRKTSTCKRGTRNTAWHVAGDAAQQQQRLMQAPPLALSVPTSGVPVSPGRAAGAGPCGRAGRAAAGIDIRHICKGEGRARLAAARRPCGAAGAGWLLDHRLLTGWVGGCGGGGTGLVAQPQLDVCCAAEHTCFNSSQAAVKRENLCVHLCMCVHACSGNTRIKAHGPLSTSLCCARHVHPALPAA